MSGAVLRLVAFPEVRVHREVVPHRVLPLVVVGREVGVAVTESEKLPLDGFTLTNTNLNCFYNGMRTKSS